MTYSSSPTLHMSLVLFLIILNFFLHSETISSIVVNGVPIANHDKNLTEVLARKRRSPPPPSPPPSKDGFDNYILALQWPRTTCNKAGGDVQKCIQGVPHPSEFKIHGLWPQNTRGGKTIPSGIAFPSKEDLYSTWPKSLKDAITDSWPNIVYGDDYEFWKHEWKDHGAHSDYTKPYEYFKKTNYLYQKFKISTLVNALRNAGNPVEVGHAYDISTLTTTFKEALGVSLQIKCCKNNNEIWEIYIYLGKNLKTTTGAATVLEPPSVTENCPGTGVPVTFPSPL